MRLCRAVIAIHEFGHFAVAKLCGVQVNEFSIGMGPVLWHNSYHKGTQYSLRAAARWAAMWRWKGEESPESQQAENLPRHCQDSPPRRRRRLRGSRRGSASP